MGASRNKYGLHRISREPVHINDAENGLGCKCICEKCGQKLVAAQGEIEWHFRHYVYSNCPGAQETLIHKLAKQIIVDHSEIEIPVSTLQYFDAKPEHELEGYVPDVTVSTESGDVYFEIVVRNPVSISKELFYTQKAYCSIVIDLSGLPLSSSPETVKEYVLRFASRRFIYWDRDNRNPSMLVALLQKHPFLSLLAVFLICRWMYLTLKRFFRQ